MKRSLRFLLTGLVLANLAFVHMTDAASFTWLGPLVALTLLSPLLIKLRHRLLYRVLWNTAVLLAFAQLVNHTTSAGVQYLLEDGLLLAALCQVHLLNNIGPDQKPDLLLFNSFLIAVVTSYLSLDLRYSIVFLLYAPVLVLSMQVLAITRYGGDGSGLFRRVVATGLPKAALALGITLVAFLLWPRDFERKGILTGDLQLRPPGALLNVDFVEEVVLDRTDEARASDRVAMRIHLLEGSGAAVPRYWRGAVLDKFDGRRWQRENGGRIHPHRLVRTDAVVKVEPVSLSVKHRFLPINARHIGPPSDQLIEIGTLPPLPMRRKSRYLALPQNTRILEARRLAERLAADSSPGALVETMRRHLAENFDYLSAEEKGRAKDLSEFLRGEAGAHCEYFATALAVMLRSEGVPCRLATGYASDEWDAETRVLTVRARHAHAWVEVLEPGRGWITVDPTPPSTHSPEVAVGLLARSREFISGLWDTITGFNAAARGDATAFFSSLPSTFMRSAREKPAPFLVMAGLLALIVTLRVCHRPRPHPAIRDLHAALRRAKIGLRPGETPRELLARARLTVPHPRRLSRLEGAVAEHERRRYVLAGTADLAD